MKKINELRDYLLENYIDDYGALNISGLDFSEFDGDVDISFMKVKGDLFLESQEVEGSLFLESRRVQGDYHCKNVMKFKVGDMVRFDNSIYQGIGEVVRVDTDDTVLIKSDDITDGHSGTLWDGNRNHYWFDIDDVSKLVSCVDTDKTKEPQCDDNDNEFMTHERVLEILGIGLYVSDEDNQNKHMQVCERLNSIYVSKNKDYGNSFGDQFKEHGIISSVIRLDDKMRRLKQITQNGASVEDETVLDTLYDMANYAIMTIMELEGQDE